MSNSTSTTSSTLQTGISRLPPELFRHIFIINADLEDESISWGQHFRNTRYSPLNTVRLASQVCSHWREIILGSPIIWASTIELQILRQKSDNWRKEVMRRTGAATICIRGDVWGDEASTSFFFSLLNTQWERIRFLDITIVNLPRIDLDAWKMLKRPAPNLEVFRLYFPEMSRLPLEYLTTYDADDFFADHAPCIREFHCPELNYSLFSSWIPQLHSITVTYPLSLGDLFSLLAITPLLESLKVGRTVLDLLDTENQSRRINLPALKRIDLENRFLPCLSILEQVTPSPQCTLSLTITHEELRDLTGAELDRLKAILVQYSQGQPNLKRMESLSLHVGPRKLSIFAPSRTLYPQMILCIQILSRFDLPSDFFPSILSTFSSCNFLPVTVLEFIVFPGFPSKIASFLLSLPSIEILHVNDDALRLFLDLIESHPGALPLLHTLIWEGTVFEKVNDCAAIDQYLLPILESRKCNEAPIKILDLVKCELKSANDLKYFDHMSGMKVRWWGGNGVEEYRCIGLTTGNSLQ